MREEWDAIKSDVQQFPFAKIPVLVIDNKTIIAQSSAINRYLAKQFNLFGSTDIESALIDSVNEELIDIKAQWNKETDENKVQFINTKLPEYFGRLEHVCIYLDYICTINIYIYIYI